MTTPQYTVHWISAMSGTRRSSAVSTKAQGFAECKALFQEGARNITLSKFTPGIGAVDVEWRVALRN